jgi:hypothetical protein
LSSEERTLAELPGLNACEEQEALDEDDGPFPSKASVLDYSRVDHRNVEYWEECDEACEDREEEKLVAPDVVHPLCEIALGVWYHAEEGAAEVDDFPGEEDGELKIC